jgi:cytosine/creatinine deaminase
MSLPAWCTAELQSIGLRAAIDMARKSQKEGGVPIGSAIIAPDGTLIAVGHNQRVQRGSWIHHAEMNCIENLPREAFKMLHQCVLVTTLSPCAMCSGAILLYKIPYILVGENTTFKGEEDLLRERGKVIVNLDSEECKELMREFIQQFPQLWSSDIGDEGKE